MRIETVALADAPAAAWDDLARAADNVFYERWMVEAALSLRDAESPRLMLGWTEGDTLAGLLPLGARSRFGMDLATENWDQTIRALGQPLVRAGMEGAFWQAALPYLDRTAGGAFLRLSSLAADSPATVALLDLLASAGRRHEVTRRYARAILRGGTTSAEHAALHIRGKVLKEHRRLRARLAERGTIGFDRLGEHDDPAPWIDSLFALELTGWKGREGVAAGADPATERAFRTILVQAQARGRLDLHRLAVAEQPIAMLACIEGPGRTAIQLKIAYDESWAQFSPGVLLEMEYLTHALDRRGLSLVDSCARAGHPMIDRIWPERREIVSLAIPFDRWSSRLAVAAQATARRWRRKEAA